jgi:hypothetical protein
MIPATAHADGHRAGLFGGISFARGSTLTGGHFSYERSFQKAEEKHFYLTGDYSLHDGDQFVRHIGMIGGNGTFRWKFLSGSFRGLFGSVWGDGSSNFSYVVGGSVDLIPTDPAVRSKQRRVELRVILDEIVRTGDPESFWRVSIGGVLKLPN